MVNRKDKFNLLNKIRRYLGMQYNGINKNGNRVFVSARTKVPTDWRWAFLCNMIDESDITRYEKDEYKLLIKKNDSKNISIFEKVRFNELKNKVMNYYMDKADG